MLSFKDIRELQKNGKARRMQGLFITEGIRMFSETPRGQIVQTVVSETFAREHADLLEGVDYETAGDSRFAGLCDTKTPQGILTVVRQREWTAEEILQKENPLVLVLENLQDPGNAGTILRTAEAAGADGIFLTEGSVDICNPKTIRSTMGSIFRVPHVYVRDIDELLELLMMKNVRTYAAWLDAPGSYLEGSYGEGTAFLIGNEGSGLTEELANKADRLISIPMQGNVESLNAAMASGILLYEAARQRNFT